MQAMQKQLEHQSFIALWGRLLVVSDDRAVAISETAPSTSCLTLALDIHLEAIAEGFAIPRPRELQLSLFPVLATSVR